MSAESRPSWMKVPLPEQKRLETRKRRQSGLIKCLVGGAAALMFYFFSGRFPVLHHLAYIAGGFSVFFLISSHLIPVLFDFVDQMFLKLAHGVGTLLTWIILPLVYFLIIWPSRLLMSGEKDPLRRKVPPVNGSYWVDRPQVSNPEAEARKQF